jgi:outer membrane protein OmpA-like peptidoglycan-associated protein
VKVPPRHESTRYIEATQQPIREMEPEPVAEPVAEPVSRTYLVFFDFDKHQLTREAASILRQAAIDAKEGKAVAVEVVGHADRAGTDDYNMDLSQRRATTVYMALQQLGIPTEYIEALARGETDPLIPTDDGVREPQNRRVEITYMISPE